MTRIAIIIQHLAAKKHQHNIIEKRYNENSGSNDQNRAWEETCREWSEEDQRKNVGGNRKRGERYACVRGACSVGSKYRRKVALPFLNPHAVWEEGFFMGKEDGRWASAFAWCDVMRGLCCAWTYLYGDQSDDGFDLMAAAGWCLTGSLMSMRSRHWSHKLSNWWLESQQESLLRREMWLK